MQAKLTVLIWDDDGWLMRFYASDTDIFQATLAHMKALALYERFWDPEACAGKGAWWIAPAALARLAPFFSNYHQMRCEAEWERAEAEREREQEARRSQEQQWRLPAQEARAFALLSVSPFATLAQVQTAYRTLALRHHPDWGGTHEQMVALNLAYEVACAFARARVA